MNTLLKGFVADFRLKSGSVSFRTTTASARYARSLATSDGQYNPIQVAEQTASKSRPSPKQSSSALEGEVDAAVADPAPNRSSADSKNAAKDRRAAEGSVSQDQPPSSKRKVEAEDAELAAEAEPSTAEVPTSNV